MNNKHTHYIAPILGTLGLISFLAMAASTYERPPVPTAPCLFALSAQGVKSMVPESLAVRDLIFGAIESGTCAKVTVIRI